MSTPFTQRSIRCGLVEFMGSQPFTHSLTLNSDRELSDGQVRSIFGTFCMRIDRATHERQRVRRLPSVDRFNAIAFPEHLDTNAHLHVLADLSSLAGRHPDPRTLEQVVRRCWLQSTRGAGSVDVQGLRSNGFASYASKCSRGLDPLYFLASDYHPR